MKKNLLILFAVMGTGIVLYAQDVILKKDGSEIIAKVIEITEQQIKYNDFDFQTGPIRNINISEVFMIKYENGQKEVFKEQTTTSPSPEKFDNNTFTDLKIEFDRIGTNDAEMLIFFKNNNFTKYYNAFESACRARNTGRKLLGAGIGLTAGGLVCAAIGLTVSYNNNGYNHDPFVLLACAGIGFMCVGDILTIASIPVSAVAGARKKAIKNNFAREYFGIDNYTYNPTINFGLTSGGIGFSMKF